MVTDKTESEVTVDPSPKALWEEFERTGSIKTYLLLTRKNRNKEKLVLAPLIFLS